MEQSLLTSRSDTEATRSTQAAGERVETEKGQRREGPHHSQQQDRHKTESAIPDHGWDQVKVGFKCFYTNIDSLNNKKVELEAHIVMLNPDIIGLSEINPKNAKWKLTQEDLQIRGYTMYDNLKGRGVVLYVRENIKSNLVSVIDSGAVAVWCEIALKDEDRILIGLVYRSPAASRDDNNQMLDHISQMMTGKASHILLMGDFNYPGIDWIGQTAENEQERLFLDRFRDWFLW